MSVSKPEICLNWRRFGSWKEVSIFVNKAEGPVSCIYAQTDADGNLLRIGKTDRLRGRYWSDTGTLDASMHNSGNRIYVGILVQCSDGSTPRDVDEDMTVRADLKDGERELIFRHHPIYNYRDRNSSPSRRINFRHLGDAPKI